MPRDPALSSRDTSTPPQPGSDLSLPPSRPLWLWLLLAMVSGIALYLLADKNYLLFHVLVELFSIVLAAAVFTIGWNARNLVRSPLFLILATGFLATGLVDLFHTLTYKGMGVFPVVGSNLSIQLWIVARSLEAITFLLAALHLGRPLRFSAWFWLCAFASVAAALLVSVWPLQIFPQCFGYGMETSCAKRRLGRILPRDKYKFGDEQLLRRIYPALPLNLLCGNRHILR